MPENGHQDDNESLISHLEALRMTLIRCFVSLAIFLPITFYFSPKILNYLINIIIGNSKVSLNYFSPVEVFMLQIKMALVLDIIICFPYIVKQIWNFILPALYENEKKFLQSAIFFSTFLFLCGVSFCIFIILPWIIKFGISFSNDNINAMFGISNIVTLTLWLSVVFGLMFQMPLITHLLIKTGVFSYEFFSTKRSYVAVILLICAAILTPPDIISQIMLFIPTYLLFELGLFLSRKYK